MPRDARPTECLTILLHSARILRTGTDRDEPTNRLYRIETRVVPARDGTVFLQATGMIVTGTHRYEPILAAVGLSVR